MLTFGCQRHRTHYVTLPAWRNSTFKLQALIVRLVWPVELLFCQKTIVRRLHNDNLGSRRESMRSRTPEFSEVILAETLSRWDFGYTIFWFFASFISFLSCDFQLDHKMMVIADIRSLFLPYNLLNFGALKTLVIFWQFFWENIVQNSYWRLQIGVDLFFSNAISFYLIWFKPLFLFYFFLHSGFCNFLCSFVSFNSTSEDSVGV